LDSRRRRRDIVKGHQMKAAKWRDFSDDELEQKVRELSEEIFNLRFQLSMGVAKNPSRIGVARRDLARAKTIQGERATKGEMAAGERKRKEGGAESGGRHTDRGPRYQVELLSSDGVMIW